MESQPWSAQRLGWTRINPTQNVPYDDTPQIPHILSLKPSHSPTIQPKKGKRRGAPTATASSLFPITHLQCHSTARPPPKRAYVSTSNSSTPREGNLLALGDISLCPERATHRSSPLPFAQVARRGSQRIRSTLSPQAHPQRSIARPHRHR